jgi:hypothetical protein
MVELLDDFGENIAETVEAQLAVGAKIKHNGKYNNGVHSGMKFLLSGTPLEKFYRGCGRGFALFTQNDELVCFYYREQAGGEIMPCPKNLKIREVAMSCYELLTYSKF